MRLVSLACSNTEIVCALGRADRLVGVDDHSDHPPEVVSRLPRVGPDLDIDVEKVAALDPDLVLATLTVPGHERVVERLEAAGLPFVAPAPESLDDVYCDIRRIGSLLDASSRAEGLIDEMRSELDATGSRRSVGASGGEGAGADRPTVLVQWWPKPTIAPGRRSWTTDVIRAAGGRNPLEGEDVKSRPVDDEEVRRMDPDAIVVSWCGVDPAKYRPEVVETKEAWREVTAVRKGRVRCVPEAYLGRPGPRLVDGVRALRALVREIREDAGVTPRGGRPPSPGAPPR